MEAVANSQSLDNFSGFKWVGDFWGSEPRWTVHLDREAIKQTVQSNIPLPGLCKVKLLAQGAFNKLYIVSAGGKEVVVRVTLPVDPKWKTLSEVATLQWVRTMTKLPVPEVLAYGANRDNPIGFEFIIMEKIHGNPLADVWQKIDFQTKALLACKLASFCAETFQQQTKRIGNLLPTPGNSMRHLKIGRIVSAVFIWNDHIHQDVPRGPFRSSKAWLSARLTLAENDCRKRLSILKKLEDPDEEGKDIFEGYGEEEGDEDEVIYLKAEDWQESQGSDESQSSLVGDLDAIEAVEDQNEQGSQQKNQEDRAGSLGSVLSESSATTSSQSYESKNEDLEELENTMFIISKLRSRLDEFFPVKGKEREPTMIFHDDLSRHNILVDEKGVLTGVVDWECVSALPLWIACQFPPVLQGKRLDEEPIESEYPHDENGAVDELYWEHLENYELTQLRRIFLREMKKLEPRWVEVFNSSQQQRDFDLAVTGCGDSFLIRRICNWLKDMDSRVENFQGLEERIENESL